MHRASFAPPSTATVGTGGHIQQKLIYCAQSSHAEENIQQKESTQAACFENLPDDILVCGVIEEILVQPEGRHLFCRQQTWLGWRCNSRNVMQASGASVKSIDCCEAANEASVLSS